MVASSRGLAPWWAKMAWASRRIVSAADWPARLSRTTRSARRFPRAVPGQVATLGHPVGVEQHLVGRLKGHRRDLRLAKAERLDGVTG